MAEKVQLSAVLSALQDNSISVEERRDKYGCLCLNLHGSTDKEISQLLAESLVHSLQDLLVKDIQNSDLGIAQAALQTLGICLHNVYIVNKFTNADTVISTLCRVIIETTDKICCTRALWCINKQNLPATCIRDKLHEILKAVEHGQCKKNFQSLTVEYEALCAVVRLLDQVPTDMERYANCWGKLVYPLLLHDAAKIRQQAMVAMDKGLDAMLKHQEELLPYLLFDLKSDKKTDSNSLLLSQMTKLMNTKLEVHILKVWAIYIKLLGKAIHHGSLINKLLPIVEKGFKNSSPEVKVAAYRAWKELINNFGLNKDIISDPKRIKLVMQVFRLNNARSDSVAMEKVNIWWYFVCCLKETASLYFDMVCLPLLQYAVSGQINLTGLTPGKTPNRIISANQGSRSPGTPSFNGPTTGSPSPTFLSVQLKGCEILAHVLGKVKLDPENSLQLEAAAPEHNIILGVAFFVKHHVAILGVVKEYFLRLGEQINDFLLQHIWGKTVDLVKSVIQSGTKADSVDVLQSLLQVYEAIVENQIFSPRKLIKLLEVLLTLPAHVLSSSSYSLGGTVLMQHNGALFLLGCLFHHRILETSCNSSSFCAVADKLINLSLSCELSGLHIVEKILDLIQATVFKMEKADGLARLWMSLANPLNQHLQKTGDINQGTGLEYDFTCVLTALSLSVTSILPAKLSQSIQASLLKCWSKLYETFAQLAALVNTAPSNIACEEICSKILPCITQDRVEDEIFVNALSHLLTVIVESVDFSSISQSSHFGFTGVSTQVRNQKISGLQNLVSLIHLTDKLLLAAEAHAENSINEKVNDTKKPRSACLSGTFLNLIQVLTSLFTHLTTSDSVAALVGIVNASVGRLYELIGKKQHQGISQTVIAKAEKMWQDVVFCLQSRYSGPYDTDFLSILSPLLQSTFLHPRQKIKSQTLNFWNATFAHTVHLVYPANLRPVLTKVKDKAAIILPGWTSSDVACIQETPNSFISQVESQVSLPNIIGVRSPNKMQGSFLKKVIPEGMSPLNPKLSKADSPQNKGKTKPALDIEDLKDGDFVVIKSSPKKLTLTKHQKEILKERSAIPALYSNVDSSQDLSLMDKFVSSESQMSMSDVICPSDTPVVTASTFPVIKESNTTVKEEHSNKMQNDASADSAMTSPSKPSNCKKFVRFTSSPKKVGKENLTDVVVQNMKSTKVVASVKKSLTSTNASETTKTEDLLPVAVSVLGRGTNGNNKVAERSSPLADCKQPQLVAETGDLPFGSIFSASNQFINSERNVTPVSAAACIHSDPESLPKARNISKPLNNSLLDGIAEETVTEVVRDKNVPNLHILVEESQQVAPNKECTSEKYSEDLIEETPIKEADDTFVAGDVDLCSKKLFGSDIDTKQIVPDSQVGSEDSTRGLILSSAITKSSCASSERLGSGQSEALFDSVRSDVNLTPPTSQIPVDISSVKLSPVVSLQRLSSEETLKYSPKCCGENKKKKRNSFRKKNKEKDIFEDSMSSVRTTTASSSDESILSQQLKQSETKLTESEKVMLEKTDNTHDPKNAVTETENDSVFIVEMYSDNRMEELSESESTQNLDNKLEGKSEGSGLEMMESDSELPTPRTSGRIRKTPQRLIDTKQAQKSNTRQNTSTDSILSSPHQGSQQKKQRRRLSQRFSMEVNCSQTPGTLGTQENDVNKEDNAELCLTQLTNASSGLSQVHSTDDNNDSSRRNLKSVTKKSSTLEGETKAMKQQNKEQTLNASVKVTGKDETSKWQEAQNVDQKYGKSVTFEFCSSPISKQERSEMNVIGNANDQLTNCSPEVGDNMLKCNDGDDDSDGHSSSEDIPLGKLLKPCGTDGKHSKVSSGLDILESYDIGVEGSATNVQQHELKEFTSKVMTSTASKKKKRTAKKGSSVIAKLPGVQFKSKLRGGETLSRTLRSSAKKCTVTKTAKMSGRRGKLSNNKRRKPIQLKSTDATMPDNEDQNTGVKDDLSCVDDQKPHLGVAKDETEQAEDKVLLETEPAVHDLKGNDKEPVTEALDLRDEIEQAVFKAPSMEEKGQEKRAFTADIDKNLVKTEESNKQLSTLQSADKVEQVQATKGPLENKVLQHLDGEVNRVNKFVSPLRSPPRRGKLFSQSELPLSNKNHSLLTRASLILQRAKLGKSSSQPLQHGRGPLSITPALGHQRPGILKTANSSSPNRPGLISKLSCQNESPSSSFRPIHLPKIYSPFASPSAGILRKRKLSGNIPTDSPSPPNKQRRVCFNDTVETREIPSAQKHKAKARLVGRGSPKPVNRCLAMPQNSSNQSSPLIHWPDSETKNKDNKIETDLSESPSTLEITPESQLNCKQPICPEYVNCDLSIDCILPQLTSTVWSAGLGQLIRAMNITTVGQLSALSEREVHNLPIKSPKLNTLRVALHTVAGLKSTNVAQSHREQEAPTEKSPLLKLDVSDVSPCKDADSSISSVVCDPDIESRDLLDDIRHLDSSMKSTPPGSPETDLPSDPEKEGIIQVLHLLEKKCSHDTLTKLPSAQLMQIYTSLNAVTSSVVWALRNKCSNSPRSSQS